MKPGDPHTREVSGLRSANQPNRPKYDTKSSADGKGFYDDYTRHQ